MILWKGSHFCKGTQTLQTFCLFSVIDEENLGSAFLELVVDETIQLMMQNAF